MNSSLILINMFISVAFFTIMERKILGSFHMRLGPNKTGILGIFQPFSDAIKLFSKNLEMNKSKKMIFWKYSPILIFFFFMFMMVFFPVKMENNFINMNMMMFIFILGLFNFLIFWSSFFSMSKFSLISSKRCISQMISYEMGLMFFFIMMTFLSMELNMELIMKFFKNFFFLKNNLIIILFILVLSESSRIPFDFIEGESELVSGFNIEYSSIFFSLFFIYEYGMMLFFSLILSIMLAKIFFFYVLFFLFILIRSCFPRMRYDKMMILLWKFIFPLMISFMILMNFY